MARRLATTDLTQLALLAVAVVVASAVLPALQGVKQAVSTATDAFSAGIAKLWTGATLPASMPLVGSVVLGDGSEIPLAQLQGIRPTGARDANGNPVVQFTFQGQRYQFAGPADETGTYYAFAVS